MARELYTDVPASRLRPVLDRLLALPALADLAGYDGSFAAQAAAKRATSELTGRFVGARCARPGSDSDVEGCPATQLIW